MIFRIELNSKCVTYPFTLLHSNYVQVDESHAGEYACSAFNSLGTDGPSAPIHVVVQRPPVFTVTPQNLYLRKVGDSIEIPCSAMDGDGLHKPTIVWFKVVFIISIYIKIIKVIK